MAIIQEDIDEKLGIPIKVISDALSGEQYVLFYYVEKDTVEEILLSNISEVTECETYSDTFDVKIGQILSNCKENWNSRYCEGEFTKVCIQFQNSDKIRRRVEREGRGGKISDISSEWFYYEKEVRNPLDMLPWIRTFGCGAVVVESGKAELEEILYQEWKEVCVLNEFIDEECE